MTATLEQLKAEAEGLLGHVAQGEEVIVVVAGKPQARIVPLAFPKPKGRRAGSVTGMVWMAADFDAPLPDFEEYQ